MRTEVLYEGAPVGFIDWEEDAFGVNAQLDCAIPGGTRALLRCYGRTAGQPLLVGLPEPAAGRLRLRRHISRETLRQAGCADAPPDGFYLSSGAQPSAPEPPARENPSAGDGENAPPVRTGDAVLDALLETGGVDAERAGDAVLLRCPFAPDRPFALAPGFALCEVRSGQAVLRYEKKDAAT